MTTTELTHIEWKLFQYSEWLDSQGLLVPESEDDKRSHTDLVLEFSR